LKYLIEVETQTLVEADNEEDAFLKVIKRCPDLIFKGDTVEIEEWTGGGYVRIN